MRAACGAVRNTAAAALPSLRSRAQPWCAARVVVGPSFARVHARALATSAAQWPGASGCPTIRPPVQRDDEVAVYSQENVRLDGLVLDTKGNEQPISLGRLDLLKQLPRSVRFQDLRGLHWQRPTRPSVLVRDHCIIVNTSEAKAVVTQKQALLLFTGSTPPAALAAGVRRSIGGRRASAADAAFEPVEPFELCVVEACLYFTTNVLSRQMRALTVLVENAMEQIGQSITQNSVQMLLPVSNAVAAFESNLEQLHTVLNELLQSDEDMANMQLTIRSQRNLLPSEHEQVEVVLETCRQRLREVMDDCEQLSQQIEEFQSLYALRLDMYRNQLIRLNFHVNIATLGTAVSALGAGVFGMNFPFPGFEDPTAFAPYTTAIFATGLGVWLGWLVSFHASTRSRPAVFSKFGTFTNLLDEVKGIEQAVQALLHTPVVTDHNIAEHLRQTLPKKRVTQRDVQLARELLWRKRLA